MASIKGIEMKKIKNFKGHEGEPLSQGYIYLDGKEVGYYSEDFRGGPETINIKENDVKEIAKRAKKYFEENKEEKIKRYKDFDFFKLIDGASDLSLLEFIVFDILELLDYQKQYKKAKKKGYDGILYYMEKSEGRKIGNTYIMSFQSSAKREVLEKLKKEGADVLRIIESDDCFTVY